MKKVCKRCTVSKDISRFYSSPTWGTDGTDYYCIQCRLDTTAESRERRAMGGPECKNCGEKYVYYAKGLCATCYTYKCRTGKERPTSDDFARLVVDWAFRTSGGESIEDIAKTSRYCKDTIKNALTGYGDAERWQRAYQVLPRDVRQDLKAKITGRLRPRDVREIRKLAADGHKHADIGEMYDRTYSSISLIVNGHRYGHVV